MDRVEATSNTWMGLTMGCARCHDHKYDPIRQVEFYRFYAFFNTISEKGLDGNKGNAGPVLQLPSPEQQQQVDRLKHEIASSEALLPEGKLTELLMEWEKNRVSTLPQTPVRGLLGGYDFDGTLADSSPLSQEGKVVSGQVTYGFGAMGKAAEFDGETLVALGQSPSMNREKPFSLGLWLDPGGYAIGTKNVGILQKLNDPQQRQGFELLLDETVKVAHMQRGVHLAIRLSHRWPDNAIAVRTKEPVSQESLFPLVLTYDGSGKASGFKLFLEGKPRELQVFADNLTDFTETTSPFQIGNKQWSKPYKGQVDGLYLYDRMLSSEEIENLALHVPVRARLLEVAGKPFKEIQKPKSESEDDGETIDPDASKETKESREQRELQTRRMQLRNYFLTYDAPQDLRKAYSELKKLEEQKAELEDRIPTTMVMKEMEKARETFVLARGDYRNKGVKVTPNVPSCLPPFSKELPVNRLGLARWLVAPSHPLTARVSVNRFWQNYFGTGIVNTAEDFGSQGEPPSHPELLDWLATEFISSGWDIKAMQRLIVTSATYRQSSQVSRDILERDPENRLLARGPRFRLPAELVRDNALSISGLLNPQIGGPSVYPYQPKGLWEDLAFGDVFSGQSYTPGEGKDLYRRSLYTIWKRTAPPPSLVTFDAPDREKCIARRPRTNTPLQALVLLNDPTYVEAARALAERTLTEGGRDSTGRVRYAFHLATARYPDVKELLLLKTALQEQLADYSRDRNSAKGLLRVGKSPANPKLDEVELAAWTTLASMILNLDETITKE